MSTFLVIEEQDIMRRNRSCYKLGGILPRQFAKTVVEFISVDLQQGLLRVSKFFDQDFEVAKTRLLWKVFCYYGGGENASSKSFSTRRWCWDIGAGNQYIAK